GGRGPPRAGRAPPPAARLGRTSQTSCLLSLGSPSRLSGGSLPQLPGSPSRLSGARCLSFRARRSGFAGLVASSPRTRPPGFAGLAVSASVLAVSAGREPAGVLLVHRLLADAQEEGDLRPRPAVRPGVADLQRLQPLRQLPQRARRPQPFGWVSPAGRLGQLNLVRHAVNIG